MEPLIHKAYTNVEESPAAYAGVNALFAEAHRIDPRITREDVREYLRKSKTYTLHKPKRVRFARAQTIPSGYFTDVQVDLADFQKVAKANRGFRYMLVGVEVLSRHLYAIPVKSKQYNDMRLGFAQLLAQMPTLPWAIFSDQGGEFNSREMKAYLARRDIDKYSAQNREIKAAMAERAIQTIKHRLYRHFTRRRSTKWIDVIQQIVDGLNRSVNRTTGMRPIDVTPENAQTLWNRLYAHRLYGKTSPADPLHEGEAVRLGRDRTQFTKGYMPTFGHETYSVGRMITSKPPTYRLRTHPGGVPLYKSWYKEQLAKADFGAPDLKIDKVLSSRRRPSDGVWEYQVKWVGEPAATTASWITYDDIIKRK